MNEESPLWNRLSPLTRYLIKRAIKEGLLEEKNIPPKIKERRKPSSIEGLGWMGRGKYIILNDSKFHTFDDQERDSNLDGKELDWIY